MKVTKRRMGDPAVLIASSEAIKRELAWSPKFEELDSIISSAWNWLEAHPSGYEPLTAFDAVTPSSV